MFTIVSPICQCLPSFYPICQCLPPFYHICQCLPPFYPYVTFQCQRVCVPQFLREPISLRSDSCFILFRFTHFSVYTSYCYRFLAVSFLTLPVSFIVERLPAFSGGVHTFTIKYVSLALPAMSLLVRSTYQACS